MKREPWLRGADLGPDDLRALGEVTLAVLRHLDAARDADGGDEGDDDVSFLVDTPLAHVLQEAVESLAGRVRAARALGRPRAIGARRAADGTRRPRAGPPGWPVTLRRFGLAGRQPDVYGWRRPG